MREFLLAYSSDREPPLNAFNGRSLSCAIHETVPVVLLRKLNGIDTTLGLGYGKPSRQIASESPAGSGDLALGIVSEDRGHHRYSYLVVQS